MPDFENLEPFLDRDGGHILPVAPHSTSAHDFVLRRREPRPERPARRQSGTPDPIAVTGAPQLTTQEMEKAYRAAIKESRVRQKSQARRQGKTRWSRFTQWLASLFGDSGTAATKKSKQPKARERAHSRRGKTVKGTDAPPPSGAIQKVNPALKDEAGDGAESGRPARSRSRNRPRNRNRQRNPDGGTPEPKQKGEQTQAGKETSKKSGNNPSPGKEGNPRPRRRRNRRRPSGDTSSAPATSSKPRPTE